MTRVVIDPHHLSSVATFATELTDLCRKHRMWVEERDGNLVILARSNSSSDDEQVQPFTLARLPSPSVQFDHMYALEYLEIQNE